MKNTPGGFAVWPGKHLLFCKGPHGELSWRGLRLVEEMDEHLSLPVPCSIDYILYITYYIIYIYICYPPTYPPILLSKAPSSYDLHVFLPWRAENLGRCS